MAHRTKKSGHEHSMIQKQSKKILMIRKEKQTKNSMRFTKTGIFLATMSINLIDQDASLF